MRNVTKVDDGDESRARARLLAHFEDHPESVFYSRQLEVLFEREYFHWVTNRALRRLVEEGRILSESRRLDLGSDIKLLWHRKYRFYKRAAAEVFDLVNRLICRMVLRTSMNTYCLARPHPGRPLNAANSASVAKDFCAPWRVTEKAA